MLLRQKKTQGEDQNWCVILNPISSEIDKKKVAEKVSQVFHLSNEEATDLVANTPIIILDNLTRAIAVKVKDFFKSAGAETVLTNDTFQKRKCYRTVWPEQPNLSFLHQWGTEDLDGEEKNQDQTLAPDEALDEIRNLSQEKAAPAKKTAEMSPFSLPTSQSPSQNTQQETQRLFQESERWRQECLKLRHESEELKRQIERLEKQAIPQQMKADKVWLDEREKEIKQAQLLVEHTNEKYDVLKQEYANARQLYEEKITSLLQEVDRSKRKTTELMDGLQRVQNEKQLFESQAAQKSKDYQLGVEEARKMRQSLEEKTVALNQAFEQSKKSVAEVTENLKRTLTEKQNLETALAQKNREIQIFAEESRKNKLALEEKVAMTSQVLDQFKRQLAETTENLRVTQSSKQTLEVAVTQSRAEFQKLSEEFRKTKKDYEDQSVSLLKDFELSKQKHAEASTQLTQTQYDKRLLEESLGQSRLEAQKVTEEYRKTKSLYEEKLSAGYKELELARKQVSELTSTLSISQRDRQMLEQQLTQKENELRLVQEENQKTRMVFEQRLQKSTEEVNRLNVQANDLTEKAQSLQKSKEQLELTVNTQSEQIAYWHDQHGKLVPQFENAMKLLKEETVSREGFESRSRDLEKTQDQLLQQLQEKNLKIVSFEQQTEDLENRFRALQEAFQHQEKSLLTASKLLETRDRELEAARRQIRDVNAQIEHREMIQKRNQLTQAVAEKESHLKKIVTEQQRIESEIKERESMIRSILSQQETIEKEIIEAKQAQRHMAELAKREQQQKVRVKIGPQQDAAAEPADEKL